MSAQANLAGMFKPTDEETWSHELLWSPGMTSMIFSCIFFFLTSMAYFYSTGAHATHGFG